MGASMVLPPSQNDAPLSIVSGYFENDPKCDNGINLKIQNLWKMCSCKCLKIDDVCTHILFLHEF